jgi:hypothetical protein
MGLRWPLLSLTLTLSLTLAGCSTRRAPDVTPEDTDSRLSESSELDVKAWLSKSRQELAKLADGHKADVDSHLQRLREDSASATLLPTLRVPTQGAVFHQAKYRSDLGFSLPDYAAAKDAAVADHLARHRDLEAAAKLGGAKADGKTYPVEWTRAVLWALTSAQFKLATGDAQAAADLVIAHKQLLEVLDDDAKKSDLGAVLLPAGKRALSLAARAWRDPKVNRRALAADVDKAVGDWGDSPAPRFPALSRDGLAAVWGTEVKGGVAVATGASLPRVLDLFGPGLPGEGVIAVAAFLEADGRVAEVHYAYRSGIDTLYREPADVAYRLEERGLTAGKEEKSAGLHRQPFSGADVKVDVVRMNRSTSVGALVRVAPGKDARPVAGDRDPRDFGPAHLDRSFESCRMRLSPKLQGNPLTVNDKPTLERFSSGLRTPTPMIAILDREGELVSRLSLGWNNELPSEDVAALLAGLWSSYGCPSIAEVADAAESALALTWKDPKTRLEFRLPFDDKPNLLIAVDDQPREKDTERLKLIRQRDQKEREARIAAGKADVRLATGPGTVNDVPVPGLKLGASKEDAEKSLPAGREYRRRDLADGVSVLIGTGGQRAAYWARQLLVRFADGKVSEIRIRFVEAGGQEHLKTLNADPKVGVGDEASADWAGLWADRPDDKVAKWVWRDDRTERTYQRDGGGSEVTWRAAGSAAGPWRFVTSGPAPGIGVGSKKEQFVSAWGSVATMTGAAEVYRQPAKSPYEMVMVWFDGDKATRVIGVHRAKPSGDSTEQVNAALQKAWGQDAGGLGFIRRQVGRHANVLGGMYWHDDAVRVQTFVQDGEGGLRQMTEWRSWPFAAGTSVAGR